MKEANVSSSGIDDVSGVRRRGRYGYWEWGFMRREKAGVVVVYIRED